MCACEREREQFDKQLNKNRTSHQEITETQAAYQFSAFKLGKRAANNRIKDLVKAFNIISCILLNLYLMLRGCGHVSKSVKFLCVNCDCVISGP